MLAVEHEKAILEEISGLRVLHIERDRNYGIVNRVWSGQTKDAQPLDELSKKAVPDPQLNLKRFRKAGAKGVVTLGETNVIVDYLAIERTNLPPNTALEIGTIGRNGSVYPVKPAGDEAFKVIVVEPDGGHLTKDYTIVGLIGFGALGFTRESTYAESDQPLRLFAASPDGQNLTYNDFQLPKLYTLI